MSRTNTSVESMTVHLVEDRRSVVSQWGLGNSKLGDRVYTFSRLPGRDNTCPGSTHACEVACYAKRMYTDANGLRNLFHRNTHEPDLSGLPEDAEIVRMHVSGDFDTVAYIDQWIKLVRERRDVRFFGYTRSWAVPGLLHALNELRAHINVQLFASVDEDHSHAARQALVSQGWRLAWMGVDLVPGIEPSPEQLVDQTFLSKNKITSVRSSAVMCLEATGTRDNCEACGYCFNGQRGDVVFPIH
ncbi:hypothetical protein LCGC14_0955390 [marine sediment metagenome]|uniref:Gene product 88 domain-containing protein n=1 Tax=marine sediment metagenome TaxID=412755 RepID=A0A0F9QZC7_9ZZZZ